MVLLELVIKSDLYHFRSSIPSLKIDNTMTTTSGDMADVGFKGEIDGMDYKMATIRKYTFE